MWLRLSTRSHPPRRRRRFLLILAVLAAVPAEQVRRPASPTTDLNALIAEAAKDLANYQRLTAEGKLGEAGQKLEELKRAIEKLNTRQR